MDHWKGAQQWPRSSLCRSWSPGVRKTAQLWHMFCINIADAKLGICDLISNNQISILRNDCRSNLGSNTVAQHRYQTNHKIAQLQSVWDQQVAGSGPVAGPWDHCLSVSYLNPTCIEVHKQFGYLHLGDGSVGIRSGIHLIQRLGHNNGDLVAALLASQRSLCLPRPTLTAVSNDQVVR